MLTVIIPARNEEDHIGLTIRSIRRVLNEGRIPFEIIVVNDRSTDHTVDECIEAQDVPRQVRVVDSQWPWGYGMAVRVGLLYAEGDAIAIMMADGSDDPLNLVQFYTYMVDNDVDCVFGSRFMEHGGVIDYPLPKLILNRIANYLICLLFLIRYNDVTNAFKLYSRKAIEGIQPLTSTQFNLTVEMPLKCIIKGYKYAVLPNVWRNRKHGVSKFHIKEMGSRYLWVVCRCWMQCDRPLIYLAGLGIGLGVAVLAWRWNMPLEGMHSFRQTQTAITAYWLMHGSPWIAYWTPVMGPPWSIPFEFPFYQWMAALLAEAGVPLDAAGRLLSYVFLLLTVFAARPLARNRREWLIFAILMLASPIYLFWGTAFLMETLALFLSVWFLSVESDGWSVAIGTAAALCKITTFFPFFFLGLIKRRNWYTAVIPPAVFYCWNWYTDILKAQNPIAKYMVSTLPRMHAHNFGTWHQLFSWQMVETLQRTELDTFGIGAIGIFVILPILFWYLDRQSRRMVGLCCGGVILPLVAFTNLHIAHNYYDVANAIFFIGLVAIVVARLSTGLQLTCIALLLVSQLSWFYIHFVPDITSHSEDGAAALARLIQANTTPDGVIVIYGMEWNPFIPYYAHRKAMMEQSCVMPAETEARSVHLPIKTQAIIECPHPGVQLGPFFYDRGFSFGSCRVLFTQPRASSKSH